MQDRGQFNYHLRRLTGRFVRESEAGYRLRNAGRTFVQMVVAGIGIEETTLDLVPIDRDCPYCGTTTAIAYERERLYQCCPECEGTFGVSDDRSP